MPAAARLPRPTPRRRAAAPPPALSWSGGLASLAVPQSTPRPMIAPFHPTLCCGLQPDYFVPDRTSFGALSTRSHAFRRCRRGQTCSRIGPNADTKRCACPTTFLAAALFRRLCTRMSRTFPAWSTARQRSCRCLRILRYQAAGERVCCGLVCLTRWSRHQRGGDTVDVGLSRPAPGAPPESAGWSSARTPRTPAFAQLVGDTAARALAPRRSLPVPGTAPAPAQ